MKSIFVMLIALNCVFSLQVFAGNQPAETEPFVKRFYEMNGHRLFWYNASNSAMELRNKFRNILDSAIYLGLDKRLYRYDEIANMAWTSFCPEDSSRAMIADLVFTDAAIKFLLHFYTGAAIDRQVSSDQISEKYLERDISHILDGLLNARSASSLEHLLGTLEPRNRLYWITKDSLNKALLTNTTNTKLALLKSALNLLRWIFHFGEKQFIVVNIPSARLQYFENDNLKLEMKVVAGKPSTRTPRFAAYCDKVVLYPYWNVPDNIARSELLPLIKRSPKMIDEMNMQLISKQGSIVDWHTVDFGIYDQYNFPFKLRQSTGCDNSLGVIKFNLTSPYDVYLHDTNMKNAFFQQNRFLSHGCIRLEKPVELGNYLLQNRLDTGFLAAGLKNQKPIYLSIFRPIPVFVIYSLAWVENSTLLLYYKDVYELTRSSSFRQLNTN